jgi:antitoxin MazE
LVSRKGAGAVQVQVARWGNSLGLRLPKELASRLGITEGTRVELTAEATRIVISLDRPVCDLDGLLRGIEPGELQAAFDWGQDVGREAVD